MRLVIVCDQGEPLLIFPTLRVGMPTAPLRRCMTRSVTVGVPTETVGTMLTSLCDQQNPSPHHHNLLDGAELAVRLTLVPPA